MIVQAAEFWNGEITASLFYLCRDAGFTYIHLEGEFASDPRDQVLLGYDPHWNARTHQRVADRLFDQIFALKPPVFESGD